VVLPDGETRVAVEEINGMSSYLPSLGDEIMISDEFMVSDKCLELIYNSQSFDQWEASQMLFEIMGNPGCHVANVQALVANEVDFNAAAKHLLRMRVTF
jgi:hypothetical protein